MVGSVPVFRDRFVVAGEKKVLSHSFPRSIDCTIFGSAHTHTKRGKLVCADTGVLFVSEVLFECLEQQLVLHNSTFANGTGLRVCKSFGAAEP